MFTRRAVVLAAVPAALLLTGVVDGQRIAHADEYTDPVQAALKRQDARIAAYQREAAEFYAQARQLGKKNACTRFLLEHADTADPNGDMCAQARAVSQAKGIPLPAAALN